MKEVGGDHSGRFTLTTADALQHSEGPGKRFRSCVFCAPPSGFDDYAGAVEDAILNVWAGPPGGGVFVFTSSGGIYGPGESGNPPLVVTEESELPDAAGNPRSERLAAAERVVLSNGGACLRLAGLYTLDRGAHNFWLGKETVAGRSDGIVNLLHYDDAAGAVVAALSVNDPSVVAGKVFLISDGRPMTRQEICESSLKATRYAGMTVPTFSGPPDGPIGKIYDGSASNQALQWEPRYTSFGEFMASQ
jgi:nucleoside-diphosphate-sugar epimerase